MAGRISTSAQVVISVAVGELELPLNSWIFQNKAIQPNKDIASSICLFTTKWMRQRQINTPKCEKRDPGVDKDNEEHFIN